jgi:hypothetical protein
VVLNYLVWGLQFVAFVENETAFFTKYLLRQCITTVVDLNRIVTNYYILRIDYVARRAPISLTLFVPVSCSWLPQEKYSN